MFDSLSNNESPFYQKTFGQRKESLAKVPGGFINDGFTSRFNWKPANLNDFGRVICKAANEIGSTECSYEIKLGGKSFVNTCFFFFNGFKNIFDSKGVPNPPTECTHSLKNTSAIISCQVGFHQGDPDIYCYLLRKSDNGVYKEHTRNRESCSFIVNDLNLKKLNEFWIYSSNKHGHNKDVGVHLTIGESVKRKCQQIHHLIDIFLIIDLNIMSSSGSQQ